MIVVSDGVEAPCIARGVVNQAHAIGAHLAPGVVHHDLERNALVSLQKRIVRQIFRVYKNERAFTVSTRSRADNARQAVHRFQ
jgi:hypothetical protein